MTELNRFDFSIVRNLRMKRGMTAEALAQKAGITRATIVKLESGKGNPTVETLGAIGRVFQLTASQLIQMAETCATESGSPTLFDQDGFQGFKTAFSGFEAYYLKAPAGSRTVSEPDLHENTAEVCFVVSGRVRVTVLGETTELGPGSSIRFKAIHDHEFEVMQDAELMLIHHFLT